MEKIRLVVLCQVPQGNQQKDGLFIVRLTVWGGSAPSSLTVSKSENFDPLKFASKNTLYLIVRGLKNAFCKFKLKIQRQNLDQS